MSIKLLHKDSKPLGTEATDTKSGRFRIQFSVRSLLVVTALLATWLAFEVSRTQRRQSAVKAIEESGQVVFEYQFPGDYDHTGLVDYRAPVPGLAVVTATIGETRHDVSVVTLGDASEESLKHLLRLSEVKQLAISVRKGIPNESMKRVAKLEQLVWLTIEAPITSVEELKRMTYLRQLDLIDTKLVSSQVEDLRGCLPNTRVVFE